MENLSVYPRKSGSGLDSAIYIDIMMPTVAILFW